MTFESWKRELKRYAILAVAIVILQGFVSGFISKYITFLASGGTITHYILSFLAVILILIPVDLILQRVI